ncbi:hypothetical protein H4218_004651 [Coemansia sp. IMI 209128]|nr:hypothetical protein H4218_004651 [Coemansia sp. IMI 209128]
MSKQLSQGLPRPADMQLGAAFSYVLKPVILLLTAATVFSSFKAGQHYINREQALCPLHPTPQPLSRMLLDDCLRLGVVWPTLNLLLSVVPLLGLLFAGRSKKDSSSSKSVPVADSHSAPTLALMDAAINLKTMVVAASLVAAAAALVFVHVTLATRPAGVYGYHLMYWRSSMAFWQVLSLTCSYDLLGSMSPTSNALEPAVLGVHWSVVVATVLQLALCMPVESILAFSGSASLPLMPAAHLRFVLVSTLTATMASYVTVRSYLLRFHTARHS